MAQDNNNNNTNNDSNPPSQNDNTMRAWVYTSAGRNLTTALRLNTTAPRPPSVSGDNVLIRVTHMSPNPADYKIPELGRLATIGANRTLAPVTPGMDYAGIVSSSSLSEQYKPGTAVFGTLGPTAFGSLGEYVRVSGSPARIAKSVVPLPEGVSPADAATLGVAAQTALQALTRYVRPGKGDEVFVNGGSGGVGTYAVQIAARALGCVVTTTCSARNAELCKELGADTVLDYSAVDVVAALRARGQVFRVVVDNVGTPFNLYDAAADYMRTDGVFVQVGAETGLAGVRSLASRALLPSFLGGGTRPWKMIVTDPNHDDLAQLAAWLKDGTIRAVIDGDPYPFEDAPKAFEKLKTGRTRGNLVVKVSE